MRMLDLPVQYFLSLIQILGGAVLSFKSICAVPIKFIGVGEKIEDLDSFYPERIASRILGMGMLLVL